MLEVFLVIEMLDFSKPLMEVFDIIALHIGGLYVKDLIHSTFDVFAYFLFFKVMRCTLQQSVGGLDHNLEFPE